jgi:class 3 adenylate cyclase
VAKLSARERAALPDSAFAYIDSNGGRRLPINDEAHVRNALARFDRVAWESDEARDRARAKLLLAAKRFGIMPVGFINQQLRSERRERFTGYPTGSVTFLLTDIEGSTALLRQLDDEYAALLREVRAAIRSCVKDAGGHTVDARADEYFAVFADPDAAVAAAVAIQHAMHEGSWPGDAAVRLRIGLHTGRPTLTESGYVGLSVHTVARISTCAHGGQTLVSSQTHGGVHAPPAGIAFRDLGEHRLAGLPKPERLFQLNIRGMPSRFPALRLR